MIKAIRLCTSHEGYYIHATPARSQPNANFTFFFFFFFHLPARTMLTEITAFSTPKSTVLRSLWNTKIYMVVQRDLLSSMHGLIFFFFFFSLKLTRFKHRSWIYNLSLRNKTNPSDTVHQVIYKSHWRMATLWKSQWRASISAKKWIRQGFGNK